MNSLLKRTITGFVLVLIIACSVLASRYSFLLLFLLIGSLGLWEFYRLSEQLSVRPQKYPGILFAACLYLITALVAMNLAEWKWAFILAPLTLLIFAMELFSSRSENPVGNLAFTCMGILAVSVPFSFLAAIAFLPAGYEGYRPALLLGYFSILWLHDSGAYLAGKTFGKHPLFKRISPGKTWEGSIGGILCVLPASFLIASITNELNVRHWLILAALVAVTGTFGDLLKSMLKRSVHVKDSGNMLPGHGGILDRFDSLSGSAPFVYIYLSVFS